MKIIKHINKVKHLIFRLVIVVILALCSCEKFLEVPTPIGEINAENVFGNEKTAEAAVVGIYSQMMTSNLILMNGGISLYPALSADEVFNTVPNTTADPFRLNAIPGNSTALSNNLWRSAYSYIYYANACIEGLSNSESISENAKGRLTGEALFARSICYFYLINLFGDVPLHLTTDYNINRIAGRTPYSEIYQNIIQDLTMAESLLPAEYTSDEKIRPNKHAVSALLARVYLYLGDYANAAQKSSGIIESGTYELERNDLNNVFIANNSEAIWQLLPISNTWVTGDANAFIPTSTTARPTYSLYENLINSFEDADNRKVNWINTVEIGGTAYHYPYKYKIRSSAVKSEYNCVLRLAEQYLIRAESRLQRGDITGAVEDINEIRSRAGLGRLSASLTQEECFAAIFQERRVEFFAEWGHRWFDLKRTNQLNALAESKEAIEPTDVLYPIPISEILRNPSLTQNPGYN